MCASKGFLAAEADNVDITGAASGFPITPADQAAFIRYLADTAHSLGLAFGLKVRRGRRRRGPGSLPRRRGRIRCSLSGACACLPPARPALSSAARLTRTHPFSPNLLHPQQNTLGQAEELVDAVDFAVNEQCSEYDECGDYKPFVTAGKPVFNV
jgi:hypothetical protein